MENIYVHIQQQIKAFNELPVRIVDGYDFKQSDTLKRIYLYQNGKFYDQVSDKDDRVFFDITTPTIRNAAKNIDLDTKDIQIRGTSGESSYFKSWLYRRKAKDWLHENGIAKKLNSIPEKVSGVGTIVVKKVEGSRVFDFVDLRNLACDPTAEFLNNGWTDERHYYTPLELRAQVERGWDKDKIEEAIKNFTTYRQENFVGEIDSSTKTQKDAQYICVHEYYGYVEKRYLTDNHEDTDLVLSNFIVILPAESGKKDNDKRTREGLTLFKTELKEMPYKELHYRRVAGRWLGKGLYEECFPMQEVENTRGNWLLTAMEISQKIVFQTRSKTALQNVLNDIDNGSILKFASLKNKPNEPMLERVDTQIKDNASSNLLEQNLQRVLQNLTNSFEVTTGETLPSGTPYSLGALMNQNANKLFDFIREEYGVFLEEIFNDWVLPELEKEMKKDGIVEIFEKDEMEYIREHLTNWHVWDSIKKSLMNGMKPTSAQVSLIENFVKQQLEKQESLYLDYPAEFLSFKKQVRCVVTDESESPVIMQSISSIMQVVMQNPAVLELPAFQKVIDMIGMNKIDFTPKSMPSAPAPTNPALAPV